MSLLLPVTYLLFNKLDRPMCSGLVMFDPSKPYDRQRGFDNRRVKAPVLFS